MTTATAPERSDQLEEVLLDDKRRGELLADPAKFRAFTVEYARKAMSDGEIGKAIESQTRAVLEKFVKDQGFDKPVRRLPASDDAAKGKADPDAVGADLNGKFKSAGEFYQKSWHGAITRSGIDARLKALNESEGAEGQFLVPEEFRAELLKISLETALVRPRARVIPMGRQTVSLPAIRDTSHASSVYGGVVVNWAAEGADVSSNTNQPTFAQARLDAKKLTAYTVVGNELLSDSAIALEATLNPMFAEAIAYFEDDAFIAGSGAGQPLGVLNADALVSVSKETGQNADTIVWENIVKMFSRMLPSSLMRGVWYCNPDVFPQLATMSLSVGTGGSAVWLNNGVAGPPATILGRPVFFTEKSETVGDAGDLMFVDFSYYLIGDRQSLTVATSPHVQFVNDRTVWRFIQRVDGRPAIDSAITPRNGTNTLSPMVALAARA